MDPDVVRWGLHLLDVCTVSNSVSPSIITRCDPGFAQIEYVREGFFQPTNMENDAGVERQTCQATHENAQRTQPSLRQYRSKARCLLLPNFVQLHDKFR